VSPQCTRDEKHYLVLSKSASVYSLTEMINKQIASQTNRSEILHEVSRCTDTSLNHSNLLFQSKCNSQDKFLYKRELDYRDEERSCSASTAPIKLNGLKIGFLLSDLNDKKNQESNLIVSKGYLKISNFPVYFHSEHKDIIAYPVGKDEQTNITPEGDPEEEENSIPSVNTSVSRTQSVQTQPRISVVTTYGASSSLTPPASCPSNPQSLPLDRDLRHELAYDTEYTKHDRFCEDNGYETVCFCCKVRCADWRFGEDIDAVHARISPNCP